MDPLNELLISINLIVFIKHSIPLPVHVLFDCAIDPDVGLAYIAFSRFASESDYLTE